MLLAIYWRIYVLAILGVLGDEVAPSSKPRWLAPEEYRWHHDQHLLSTYESSAEPIRCGGFMPEIFFVNPQSKTDGNSFSPGSLLPAWVLPRMTGWVDFRQFPFQSALPSLRQASRNLISDFVGAGVE